MYQIITDTSALFTPEEGKAMGIEVLPLCVTIGDWEGRDLLMDMPSSTAISRTVTCPSPLSLL